MILVFGKTGQVAKELQKSEKVLCVGRDQVDLTNPMISKKLIYEHNPSAVINAAAYTFVDKAEDEEELANIINGEAPAIMSNACKKLNIPFVHLSTDYVFNGQGSKPWKHYDITNPLNAYGRSKLLGENAIRNSGANYVILRTSWIISAHGNNFLKTILQLSNNNQNLRIISDQIGGPTPAKEIAKTCLSITSQLQINPSKSGTYHFSGTPDISWFELASAIFDLTKSSVNLTPIPSEQYPTQAKRPHNSRLDCAETFEQFDINQPNWHLGVKNILRELEII